MSNIIAQRDSRWSSILLGFGKSTIGQVGCVVSSISDGLLAAGYQDLTPDVINTKLKTVPGAFTGTTLNLIDWTKLQVVLPIQYVATYNYDTVPAPLDQLSQYLSQGMTVLLRVNAKAIGGTGDHFLRAISVQGSEVIVHDPWWAEEASITKRYTQGTVNTAAEIILGFRVMKITINPNGDQVMQADEMIIKKTDFTNLVTKSGKWDNIATFFSVDPVNGSSNQVTDSVTQLKTDKASSDTAATTAQNQATEYQSLYNTEKVTSAARKEEYDNLLQYFAGKLGSIVDEATVKGKLDFLLGVEDQLTAKQKEIDTMTAQNITDKKGLQDQISSLLQQLDTKTSEINDLKNQVLDLSKKIDNQQQQEQTLSFIQKAVQDLVLFFEKITASRRNSQATGAQDTTTTTTPPDQPSDTTGDKNV